MRSTRLQRTIAVAALVATIGIGGCQSGDSGGGETQGRGSSVENGVTAIASSVTVTYYYLPG